MCGAAAVIHLGVIDPALDVFGIFRARQAAVAPDADLSQLERSPKPPPEQPAAEPESNLGNPVAAALAEEEHNAAISEIAEDSNGRNTPAPSEPTRAVADSAEPDPLTEKLREVLALDEGLKSAEADAGAADFRALAEAALPLIKQLLARGDREEAAQCASAALRAARMTDDVSLIGKATLAALEARKPFRHDWPTSSWQEY